MGRAAGESGRVQAGRLGFFWSKGVLSTVNNYEEGQDPY